MKELSAKGKAEVEQIRAEIEAGIRPPVSDEQAGREVQGMALNEEVAEMVAQLSETEKAELLAKHGRGLPIEKKYEILTEYFANRQSPPKIVR